MNTLLTYQNFKVKEVPVTNLVALFREELRALFFDCGQKCSDIDSDFDYIVQRCAKTMSTEYPEWLVLQIDRMLKKGRLGEFDSGIKITFNRLERWMYTHNKQIVSISAKKSYESTDEFHPENKIYRENARRLGLALSFRIMRKPQYDADEWTLAKIAETDDFKRWVDNGARVKVPYVDIIAKKV